MNKFKQELTLVGIVLGIAGTLVLGTYASRKYTGLGYAQRYQAALEKCADTNNDGIITYAERDAFDERMYSGKNVKKLPGELPTYNGKTVSYSTLEKWAYEAQEKCGCTESYCTKRP